MTKKGQLRQDDHSHWYLIPVDKIEAFEKLCFRIGDLDYYNEEWHDAVAEFEKEYNQHRIDNPFDLKITIG